MSLITLTTDFGLKDGFVGAMKGVIWSIAPQTQIADISHEIGPQNIREAGLILMRVAPFYPAGSIHVVVVDPGVGTERRNLLASLGEQYYIGPDNGIITAWLEMAERQGVSSRFYSLDRPTYWLPEVTNVFHGRDIFAPAAAHLASGISPETMGTPISDPVRLALPKPRPTLNGWQGEIMHIDYFGNLITNLEQEHIAGLNVLFVRLSGEEIGGMVKTFGDRPEGTLAAMIGSSGTLVVAEVNGSAARRLNARVGDPVEVIFG